MNLKPGSLLTNDKSLSGILETIICFQTDKTDMDTKDDANRAFENAYIENVQKYHDGYMFNMKGLNTRIRLILTVNPEGGYNYYMSHSICTQTQRGNHLEEHPWGEDIPSTIQLALDSLTFHFREAVERGYQPIEEWMIANPWAETMAKFF